MTRLSCNQRVTHRPEAYTDTIVNCLLWLVLPDSYRLMRSPLCEVALSMRLLGDLHSPKMGACTSGPQTRTSISEQPKSLHRMDPTRRGGYLYSYRGAARKCATERSLMLRPASLLVQTSFPTTRRQVFRASSVWVKSH